MAPHPFLLETGAYLTTIPRGLQIHRSRLACWLPFVKHSTEGDISHHQALATTLATTVGVATTIFLSSSGAVFWTWRTGLIGMAPKYSEAFLGIRFHRDAAGEQSGPVFAGHGRAGQYLAPTNSSSRATVSLRTTVGVATAVCRAVFWCGGSG
ncbi:alanine:cation symporter family protein [Actinomadura sp. NPDC047616]|uniref:alanine:cation symporter family protein n=1 Tax=Actinomadura sp. NPDC047616 TaxID=3155914 RepID=UPI0033C59BEB